MFWDVLEVPFLRSQWRVCTDTRWSPVWVKNCNVLNWYRTCTALHSKTMDIQRQDDHNQLHVCTELYTELYTVYTHIFACQCSMHRWIHWCGDLNLCSLIHPVLSWQEGILGDRTYVAPWTSLDRRCRHLHVGHWPQVGWNCCNS